METSHDRSRSFTEAVGVLAILDVLRWRWQTAALVTVAVAVGSIAYIQTLPSKYTASAVVAFAPRAGVSNAGGETVAIVTPAYLSYLKAPGTVDAVAKRTSLDASTLDHAVSGSVEPSTGNLDISVTLGSPTAAARATNAFARQVYRFGTKDKLLSPRIVASAVPPTAPTSPHRTLLDAAAVIVALLAGVGVAVLLERGRPRLRSWRDMARVSGYPVVGRIPRTRRLRGGITDALFDPETGAAVRTLRANLEPQLRADAIDVVLVTSPEMGDGKTTVSALLAESFARLGESVLLLDADIKRPRLAEAAALNGHVRATLIDILHDRAHVGDAAVEGWVAELSILTTERAPHESDLLARRFPAIVREARERYDLIVVDAPPLLGADEARALARHVSGVVLVVSAGSMSQQVNESVLALESLQAPLLGLVGNRLTEPSRGYY